jgi:glycosyltransferase involved in cell wall biosynthesis
MNIGFEAKRIFTNFTGLGNYGRFIVDALSRFYPDNGYFLYTPAVRAHPDVAPITSRTNVTVVTPQGINSKVFFSSLWRSWGVSKHQTISELSVFHGLSQELPAGLPRTVKKVVSVHDLIFLRHPEFYNRIDAGIYLKKVKSACAAADCIIAISEQTASDVTAFLGADPRKIKVVYQGCHPQFKNALSGPVIQAVKAKYRLPAAYILNVGTIEERKNLAALINALAIIPESSRLPLVVVGRQTRYHKQITSLILRNDLSRWVTFVHDADFKDLPGIYQGAHIFVYPSLFEGFGIPVIEAIASGVPVITSKGSCFTEAGGPDSVYVDPHDPQELSENLRLLTGDQFRRDSMVKGSREFIKKFEPVNIAASVMAAYDSVL